MILHYSSFLLIATAVLNDIPFVQANWIDPDTPQSAYATKPRYMPPSKASLAPTKATDDDDNDGSSGTNRRRTAPPSEAPSSSPTEYPTFQPTTLKDVKQSKYHLVMSDEFTLEGRSFADGHDPKWTALDKNDYTNNALHYYSPDNVRTENGDLIIKSEAKHVNFVGFNNTIGKDQMDSKNFKSAMLQTWNKFCFTGGIIEAEIQLPGVSNIGGLWPAFWILGNIVRHTYVGSSSHVWPWSSNTCNNFTKNGQRINGCLKAQHYGLEPGFGRGAPEIDIFEVMTGTQKANTGDYLYSSVGQPFMSASYQVAPGRSFNRPGGGLWPGPGQWYDGLTGGTNTTLNINFYGDYNHLKGDSDEKDYWSDAVSYNHQLQNSHFEEKYKYRVEWELPDEDTKFDGYIRWFVNDRFVLQINGTGLVDAGFGSTVSTEPMYIIMNTAISKSWGFAKKCPDNCPCKKWDCLSKKFPETCGFPGGFCNMLTNTTNLPEYKVNYVRVYQNKNDPKQKVGCSTPERPTSKYIEAHADKYKKKSDAVPLKPILVGTGTCARDLDGVSANACGGPTRGLCSASRRCDCRPGWTGPHCLSPDGFDPVQYERKQGFADLEFTGPVPIWCGLYVGLAIMSAFIVFAPTIRKRMDGWRPIP